MNNISTKEFCRRFDACREGTRFALKFDTMRECYAALLAGEAGDNNAEWALWTVTLPGVMPDQDLRLFAVRCARRVQNLMPDERSISALDVAERYANGDANAEELDAASASASAAAWSASAAAWTASAAASAAAWASADAASSAAWYAAWDAAWDAEHKAQFGILAEFGNPFEVEND